MATEDTSRASRKPEAAPPAVAGTVRSWMRKAEVLQPASRRAQVLTELREAIVSGAIAPGEQLKQDELSAHFGVSPAPVREALRTLESEGLVEHYPNRGSFVTEVSVEESLGVLLPVRLVVESFAMKKAAQGLSSELVEQLEEQIAVMERGADALDLAVINEADIRFHQLAVMASGAYHTIQLWNSILPRIRVQFYRLARRHTDVHVVAAEHRELLRTLQAGDAATIDKVLQEHIIGTSSALIEQENSPRKP